MASKQSSARWFAPPLPPADFAAADAAAPAALNIPPVALRAFETRHMLPEAADLLVNLDAGFHIQLRCAFARRHDARFKRSKHNELLLVSSHSHRPQEKRVHLDKKVEYDECEREFKMGDVVVSELNVQRSYTPTDFNVDLGLIELDKLWGRKEKENRERFKKFLGTAGNLISTAAGVPQAGTIAAGAFVAILDIIDALDHDDVVINRTLDFQIPGTGLEGDPGRGLHRGFYVVLGDKYDASTLRISFMDGIKLVHADDNTPFTDTDYIIVQVHDYPVGSSRIALLPNETAEEFAARLHGNSSFLDKMNLYEVRGLLETLVDQMIAP